MSKYLSLTPTIFLNTITVEKPPDWDTMPSDSSGKEVPVHLVDQKPGSNEYNDVLSKFDLTMKGRYTNIVSIQRMQNPIQYGQYVARKREMEKRNPTGCKNELMLFHGTKPNVVESINTQGFNRSFKNGESMICIVYIIYVYSNLNIFQFVLLVKEYTLLVMLLILMDTQLLMQVGIDKCI